MATPKRVENGQSENIQFNRKVLTLHKRRNSRRPPTDEIVPVFRRDCHQQVHAGSHQYPGSGIYLLKFDNSYSLWRSKVHIGVQELFFFLFNFPEIFSTPKPRPYTIESTTRVDFLHY